MDNLIGRTFGGYEVTELIDAESKYFSNPRIYKAFDKKLARWSVIELVSVESGSLGVEDEILTQIEDQAQAIAALRHCNISIFYGYGVEEDWAYTIKEYIPRGSLKHRLDTGKIFAWEQAFSIMMPVAQALIFAHKQGVIHKKIKPANVLLPQDNWPLLVFDLELARMVSRTSSDIKMGQDLGEELIYAAPEQIQESDSVDARADIYSLGLVLYQLLSGKLPYKGETSFDFLMARFTDFPLPLSEASPGVPSILGHILDTALAVSPNQRYQSMAEFLRALIEAGEKLSRRPDNKTQFVPRKNEGILERKARLDQEAKIVLRLTDSGDHIFPDDQPELIVGRASKNINKHIGNKKRVAEPTIDLTPYGGRSAGVSRQHSRLLNKGNQWFIEDLGSTNGTFVNDTKIPPNKTIPVQKGDFLRFGEIELEFRLA